MSSLIEAVNTVTAELARPPAALRRPYVRRNGSGEPVDIVTGDAPEAHSQDEYRDVIRDTCGVTLGPDTYLELVEAWCNEAAWTRDKKGQQNAVTRLAWRYRFKVSRRSALEDRTHLHEIDAYVKTIKRKPRTRKERPRTAVIVNIADLQISKVDERGGTPELEARFYGAMQEVIEYVKRIRPDEIVLAELGDGCENFQNTPVQKFTNDRNLIQQLDMHADFILYAAKELAKLTDTLTVVGVPSNHMEVREDGQAVGGPDNDYGLLTLRSIQRSFELNPDAFGHVKFAWPDEFDVTKVLNVAGLNVAFTHGHYARGAGAADNVPKWLEHQFATFHPIRDAQLVITGHFHHYRMGQIIGGRWWYQCPALDNGSAWLRRVNGQGDSSAGILVLAVDAQGVVDHRILGNEMPPIP